MENFNEAYEAKELSISQRRGIITLIPKEDGSPLDLSNWRPITLLNVDCKIATKAIAKENRIFTAKASKLRPDWFHQRALYWGEHSPHNRHHRIY